MLADVLLPGAAWAEKRGSMLNVQGRLQRLNRAVAEPGNARDDWEILADLLRKAGGTAPWKGIDDVFRDMAGEVPGAEGAESGEDRRSGDSAGGDWSEDSAAWSGKRNAGRRA